MSLANQRRMLAECSRSLYAVSNSSVFKIRLKVPRSSASQQIYSKLYDSEFHMKGATQNACADNVSDIRTLLHYLP